MIEGMTADEVFDAIRKCINAVAEYGNTPRYVTMHPELKEMLVNDMIDRVIYGDYSVLGTDKIMGLELLTDEKAKKHEVYVSAEPLEF